MLNEGFNIFLTHIGNVPAMSFVSSTEIDVLQG